MSTALIALKLTEKIPQTDADYIGADSGALTLAGSGIRMKLAIGDFDSVSEADLALIRKMSDEMIILNPIKDESDSESALNHVLAMGYDRIFLYGALGGRIDHSIINLRLVYQHPSKVCMADEQNFIEAREEGRHVIAKQGYQFISFFTEDEAVISLENMKYPLSERRITAKDLYTVSNEILGEEGVLTVHSGRVLIIQSNDRK